MRRLIPALLAVLALAAFAYERTPARGWDYDGVLDALAPWLAVKPCCVKRQALTVNGQRIYTAATVDSVRVTGSTVRAYPRTRIDSVVGATAVRWLDSTRWADSTRYHDTTVTRWLDSTRWADSVRWHDSTRWYDSVRVTPEIGTRGIPFGSIGLWSSPTTVAFGPEPFNFSKNYTDPSGVVPQIAAARTMGQKLLLSMTGGPHTDYLTNGVFDFAKWKARMDRFNTASIRAAIAAGVADGTVVGNSMMDEPEHKSWGGGVTKAVLDQMAAYVKGVFPTLPVGFNTGPTGYRWRATERYQRVDFISYQYNWLNPAGNGDVVAWRTAVLAQAALDHVTPGFSINILDGGVQDKDGVYDCTGPGQAGLGTFGVNCRMPAADVTRYGLALVGRGCLMLMWWYDGTFFARADNQAAFRAIADSAAKVPATRCVRT